MCARAHVHHTDECVGILSRRVVATTSPCTCLSALRSQSRSGSHIVLCFSPSSSSSSSSHHLLYMYSLRLIRISLENWLILAGSNIKQTFLSKSEWRVWRARCVCWRCVWCVLLAIIARSEPIRRVKSRVVWRRGASNATLCWVSAALCCSFYVLFCVVYICC